MSDREAEQLLILLERYVVEDGGDPTMRILELSEDLAMSMSPTTDDADRARRTIEQAYVSPE